jgi:hypothetical protein
MGRYRPMPGQWCQAPRMAESLKQRKQCRQVLGEDIVSGGDGGGLNRGGAMMKVAIHRSGKPKPVRPPRLSAGALMTDSTMSPVYEAGDTLLLDAARKARGLSASICDVEPVLRHPDQGRRPFGKPPVVTVIWSYTGLDTPEMEQRVTAYSQYAISANVSGKSPRRDGIKNIEAQTMADLFQ